MLGAQMLGAIESSVAHAPAYHTELVEGLVKSAQELNLKFEAELDKATSRWTNRLDSHEQTYLDKLNQFASVQQVRPPSRPACHLTEPSPSRPQELKAEVAQLRQQSDCDGEVGVARCDEALREVATGVRDMSRLATALEIEIRDIRHPVAGGLEAGSNT